MPGAFLGAWRNALQQRQQQRSFQTILRRAFQRCDAFTPEVLRSGAQALDHQAS